MCEGEEECQPGTVFNVCSKTDFSDYTYKEYSIFISLNCSFNAIRFISLWFTWSCEKWKFFNVVFQLYILKMSALQTKTPYHCSSGKCWIQKRLKRAADVARQHQRNHRGARHLSRCLQRKVRHSPANICESCDCLKWSFLHYFMIVK